MIFASERYTLCLFEGAHEILITEIMAERLEHAYCIDIERKNKVKKAMEEKKKQMWNLRREERKWSTWGIYSKRKKNVDQAESAISVAEEQVLEDMCVALSSLGNGNMSL